MALAYEKNTSIAFDTTVLRSQGKKYREIAEDLRKMASDLDDCLTNLKNNGWTTPAGSAFQKMAEVNWKTNIQKYANLLDTLNSILDSAATQYEELVSNNIATTKLQEA